MRVVQKHRSDKPGETGGGEGGGLSAVLMVPSTADVERRQNHPAKAIPLCPASTALNQTVLPSPLARRNSRRGPGEAQWPGAGNLNERFNSGN